MLATNYIFMCQAEKEINIFWSCDSAHMMNVRPLFWLFETPEGKIWLSSCLMLHHVHQLVTNFVCLSFAL